jgi:hypothetical protein
MLSVLELLGGHLEMTSTPGHGTTVRHHNPASSGQPRRPQVRLA